MEAYGRVTGGRSTVLRPGDTIALRQARGTPRLIARVIASGGVVSGEPAGAPQTRPCAAHPEHAAIPDDTTDNFRSVGLLVEYGGFRFALLGDLTWNVEHKLVCPRDLVGEVDVYQVMHHGLDISNNPALLLAARPAVAVIDNGARKGGKAVVYHRLLDLPAPPDVFQLHRNVETTAADNAPPANVANDVEDCKGEGLHLAVDGAARRYTIEVEGKGTGRTYGVKRPGGLTTGAGGSAGDGRPAAKTSPASPASARQRPSVSGGPVEPLAPRAGGAGKGLDRPRGRE
jgi:competence protein ComEC